MLTRRLSTSFLACLATLLLATTCATAQSAERPKNFGKLWVRSHPFQIMGLCQIEATFDVAEYRGAGMTTLLAWKARKGLLQPATDAGLPHFLHLYAKEGVNEEFTNRVKDLQEKYPNSIGFMINDEPSLKLMTPTREAIRWLKTNYPDRVAMSNAFPIGGTIKDYAGEEKDGYGYSEYLADFVRNTESDIVMFDIYPFGDGEGSGVSDVYFQNLEMVRREARKADLPYWTFIQSYQTTNRRHPSESDLRMQIYSSLTYGFTGLAYFTYDVAFDRGLLESNGEPNPLYGHAAKVNAEVANLGKTLRYLTSTSVGFVPATDKTAVPNSLKKWERNLHVKSLQNVAILDGTDEQSGLLGTFKDDAGQQYFMLTNLHQDAKKSAEECLATFRLRFDPGVKSIQRLSRETGQPETLEIADPKQGLTITLGGGTGDLFMVGGGNFVGLE